MKVLYVYSKQDKWIKKTKPKNRFTYIWKPVIARGSFKIIDEKILLEHLVTYVEKKNKWHPCLILQQINSKWIKDLNKENKSLKLLEENIGVCL